MKVTQVFMAANNQQPLARLAEAASAAPMPVAGDYVRWVVEGKTYSGRVESRVLSYSASEVATARENEYEVTATLTVKLDESAEKAGRL